MVAAARRTPAVWYPESDNMGEHELQRFIMELLRPLVARWLAAQGAVAHVGADQFFYWVQGDPTKSRAPDLYVVEGLPQDIPEVGTWKVWEGHAPAFALEVCGADWQKDYDHAPADCDAMGTRELLIYDPGATPRHRRRVRWQAWRRAADGRLVPVLSEPGETVWSQALGCFFREVDDRGHQRRRLATGEQGEPLFPTDAEAALADAERERLAKENALAEVARLQGMLATLRDGRG